MEDYRDYKPYLPQSWPYAKKSEAGEPYQRPGFDHLAPGSPDYIDHPSQAPGGIHPFPDKLHVICVLENPLRWRSRYWNYQAFENMVEKAGGILYTVEVAFGDRPFEITSPQHPRHLQLRTYAELLHKENAINLGVAKLFPAWWRKLAWIDADIQFTRPDWCQETLQLLEHYDFLQMFVSAIDLGPKQEIVDINDGFIWHEWQLMGKLGPDVDLSKRPTPGRFGYGYQAKKGFKLWHPGLCWAARRRAFEDVGGLMDWVMGGSADHYMALALYNQLDITYLNLKDFSDGYRRPCYEWQHRADRYIRQNVGFMDETVLHSWHGPKQKRQYLSRANFLAKTRFDPVHHLKRDWQGLYQLHDDGSRNFIQIRDGLRYYARLRDEDSREIYKP
jgi:hypothetical protein